MGFVCRREGGCATPEELAAEKAAAEAKKREEVERQKAEADEKRRVAEDARRAELQRREEIRASISSVKLTPEQAGARPWTVERMRGAQPLPLPVLPPDLAEKILRPRPSTPIVPLVVSEISKNIVVRQPQNLGPSEDIPLRWAGRLFFKTPDGDHTCSAQFIGPRVLVTAAHCLRDNLTGTYYTNFRFALQYNNGKFSQQYAAVCVAAPTNYVQQTEGKWLWDYGLILTDGPSITGYFGLGIGEINDGSKATAIGYPEDIAGGEVIQVEVGPVELSDGILAVRHGDPNFSHGSSGGARLKDMDTTIAKDANILFSVNSFVSTAQPGVSYGPVLGDQFKNMLNYVTDGCKD